MIRLTESQVQMEMRRAANPPQGSPRHISYVDHVVKRNLREAWPPRDFTPIVHAMMRDRRAAMRPWSPLPKFEALFA